MDPTVTASDPAAQLMDPGPSWNVPRISLPECMGVLKQYQTEWWYYVGYAFTAEGEEFSLQFEFLRAALPGQARGGCLWPWRRHTLELQVVAGPVGIGIRSINAYVWAPGFGFGVAEKPGPHHSLTVLPATDAQYGLTLTPLIGSRLSVAYTGGAPVATVGSTYRLQASGKYEETSFAFDLSFTDRRGLVMEGSSGYVGVARDSGGGMRSYEFAQPRLEITSGTVEAGGRVHALAGGWLWCDRQVLTDSTTPPAQEIDRARPDRALAATTSALYRGCWLGLALDGGLCLALAVFWQPPAKNGDKQWVTGTLVGRPPRGGFGTAYFPLDGSFASRNGGRPLKGADLHGTHDFDLNILVPDEPEESPHWVSPVSYQTYATGWQLRFDPLLALELGLPETLYLRAMVDGCENLLGNAFWEGAANVYADVEGREEPIGRAFVEQMGFN